MRKCIGCQEMKNKKELLRIVRTPEGEIVIDVTGKRNGRGAYLCRSRDCLARAAKSRGLERSLAAQVPRPVYETLEKELDLIERNEGALPAGTGHEGRESGER